MSISKALDKLHLALELCDRALDGETDPETIAGLRFVTDQLRITIELLKKERPAIPLDQTEPGTDI